MQLLSEIYDAQRGAHSEHVFPSPRGDGRVIELKDHWARLCKAAGIAGLRIHDLRHSFASQLVSGGASLPLIGALLGHSNPTTTARYAHLYDDPQRAAVERVGAIISGAPAAETVKLPKRRR
jgi:integrase